MVASEQFRSQSDMRTLLARVAIFSYGEEPEYTPWSDHPSGERKAECRHRGRAILKLDTFLRLYAAVSISGKDLGAER